MADDQITEILVAIGRVEEKVDSLTESRRETNDRLRELERGYAGIGSLKGLGLASPGIVSAVAWMFTLFHR